MGAYTAFLLRAHPGGAFEMLVVKHAFEAINHQQRVHPAGAFEMLISKKLQDLFS